MSQWEKIIVFGSQGRIRAKRIKEKTVFEVAETWFSITLPKTLKVNIKGTLMQICQYLCPYMKKICWRFHIKTPFTFWDMRTWDMWKVCLQTFRNNRICLRIIYVTRNLQTSRANNLRILWIKNAQFSGYCFYMNTNI